MANTNKNSIIAIKLMYKAMGKKPGNTSKRNFVNIHNNTKSYGYTHVSCRNELRYVEDFKLSLHH